VGDKEEQAIGCEELEVPLIGLGFADSKEEVQQMVKAVDTDGSNKIEFDEFLAIIKNSGGDEKKAKIYRFFKDVTSGEMSKVSKVSFMAFVEEQRRQHLMNALMSSD